MNKFHIFTGIELDSFFQTKITEIKKEINSKHDEYLLNVNETDFIQYIIEKYKIDNLEIHYEDVSVTTLEKMIPAEKFPRSYVSVIRGSSYKRDVIKYHIPYEGNSQLLHYQLNYFASWTHEVSDEDNCICFEIVNFRNDPQEIIQESQRVINSIKEHANILLLKVAEFNKNLGNQVSTEFSSRKQHLLKKNNLLASLGVPIKKRENVSNTFSVTKPIIREKIRVAPPVIKDTHYQPEPTLDDITYQDILKIIIDVGKQFERMPSTYHSKSEEELRDHFLLNLEPNFEGGSATGETFNKTGKTDILLRYEGNNIFIGECKFWTGKEGYLNTISQLLGYLTWRDSKAAVIMFVKNKNLSSVIEKVVSVTPTHPNFLGNVGKKEDGTWLSYRFHINNDSNREVKLAVLLFHVPSV